MKLLREIASGPDALVQMLFELRTQRPPVYQCDERQHWLAAIGQVISGIHDPQQRKDAIELITLDLCAAYGLRKELALHEVHVAVFSAEVEQREEQV